MRCCGALVLSLVALLGSELAGAYRIGVGRADVTGPIVEVTLMGYGKFGQKGTGLHTRQWSRSYIVDDGSNRLVFVNVDVGMMADGVRIQVIQRLEKKFKGLYNMDNVIISGTHTHSAVGGFMMHTFFDIPSAGFCKETFNALVSGIVKSVEIAHESMTEGRIFMSTDTILGISVNRSPTSYLKNPREERAKYKYDTDKELVQLQFMREDGKMIGAINWFAVHGTSLNNTNTLVSSDNVGYASIVLEKFMDPTNIVGKSDFVGSFASSNLGDVSPNTKGPKCHQSNTECDTRSKCEDMFEECYALGPGEDMYDSMEMIGHELFSTAWNLIKKKGVEITGPVQAIHQYVDMSKSKAQVRNRTTGKTEQVRGCRPAMGYSAGAGTTDGAFLPFLWQGMTNSTWWLDILAHIVSKPTDDDVACHAPKPILLMSGNLDIPFEWQPRIVSTQLGRIGNVVIVCVPGEFTTMSGRRMRETISKEFGGKTKVIIAGLCNTYSDYISTYEEYQAQRYEAASTLFGPHTLSLHLLQYRKLSKALINNKKLERGPEPKGLDPDKMFSLIPEVVFDEPHKNLKFGDVVVQPRDLVVNKRGDSVRVTFASANPRSDLRLDNTYFLIEMKTESGNWTAIANDADEETKLHWRRTNIIRGSSEVDIEWAPWNVEGRKQYRIRHFSSYKNKDGKLTPFEGISNTFTVHWRGPPKPHNNLPRPRRPL